MTKSMKIALIVAVAENGVIGRDNQLPWHIPADLKYFKHVTMGKPVVMGRKTYQSIGKPLPGRPNIVITRDKAFDAPGCSIVHTTAEAEMAAREFLRESAVDEVMVIGGAEIFKAFLARADRLYLTEIHRAYEGDVVFPVYQADYDAGQWQEVSRERHAGADGQPDYSFVVYDRKTD